MDFIRNFQKIAKERPNDISLSNCGDTVITYRDLDEMSGRVYRYLKEHGIGRENFVNILLPRGVEPLAAVLGVWKAGAAFVMLEDNYPAERIDFIQKDCGCKLILDRAVWQDVLQCEPLPGCEEPDDHDAAFAVYTSGSTGNPKGVLHEYGNIDVIAAALNIPLLSFGLIAPLNFVATIDAFCITLHYGGIVYIIPFETVKNPPALAKCFVSNGITQTFCAPSVYALFRNIPGLELIIVSSEPAYGIWSDDPCLSVYNVYGMSESGFLVTVTKLDVPNEIAPIGKPQFDLDVMLKDEDGNTVADDEAGEICFPTLFVRGYINLPEETDKAFVNGVYHTRDLGKRLPNGDLVVLGRIDDMIKINGNRVEPAEIENAFRMITGIKQVIAKGFADGENAFVCVYYADNAEPDTEQVRTEMMKMLPYYMIPSRFIKLDKLPRTQSGKLSRRLLPKPETETVRGTYTAPANPTEKLLCDSMAQVLGLSNVGADEDFYELGGSSISSMKLIVSCPLEGLDIGMIFMGRTARKIAALYLETRMSTVQESLILDDPQRKFPLTQTQLGIYLECERHEGESVYNNPYLTRFPADTPPEKLRNAVEAAVKAHPGLFARIVNGDDGMPAMIYCPVSSDTHLCYITKTTEEDFTGIKNSLVKPFNIKTDRLFRLDIFVTESAVYLFMDFHHIVYDGTSAHILMNDMVAAWNGNVPEPEKYTAYHVALDEKSARETHLYQWAKTWYLEQFGETESVALPDGDVREKEISYGEIKAELDVSSEELRAFCENHKITENIVTTAAFGFLLSEYTRRSDAVFATIYNGRKDLRTDRTVSMLVKTLPVLCRTAGQHTIKGYLSALKEQILGAMANDIFSFAEAAATAGISSDILFAWQDEMHDDSSLKSIGAVREELPFNATGDVLSIDLVSLQGKLIIEIQFHKNRYSKVYIENMARCYGNVLRDMLSKERLDEISLVSGEEEEKILSLSKGETLDYDKCGTWVDMFKSQAEKTPERNAVTDSEGSFTYHELDNKSDSIASYLLDNGVKPDTFVAVKMGRSKLFTAAVLGIHKSGAAYLPIDADYPEERIAYMLEDSEARIILTEDTVRAAINKYENAKPINLAKNDSLAYMIYTSGSTGKPKGVMIPHRAMLNFVHFIRYRWHLTESSRIACHSNFSFDASVEDLYPALTVGGSVFIVPEKERHDIFEMRKYIRANGINGGSYSTQFGQLLASGEILDVDYLCVGGEAMTVIPNARGPVYNAYGPTEFTVDATYFELDKSGKYDNIPIGIPVANCYAFITGRYGELLPRGIAGELCLAGPQIAEGYWKREDLTAEKFVKCPYLEGQKMYRTGDLAKYNDDGQIEYLGRIDTQVKLRGFRIELGEIESRASQFAGIKAAAAAVRKDNIVLYYVSDNETDNNAFKEFLSESLTEYMIPSVFMQLPEMPMTSNGKIDRKALPEPSVGGRAAYIEPATDKERIVAEIMGSILGVSEPVSAGDSFFELGGDSIKAIRMVSLLREKSLRISVAGIMKNKTVRGIASNAVFETAAVISQEPFEGYIKDTAIIAYFNDLGMPEPWHYGQAQLYSLAERAELRTLQKVWDSLTYQHDMLRAVIRDGRIFVRSADTGIAAEEYSAAERSEITAICSKIQSHIDMSEALVRAALIHGIDGDYLFVAAHHLVIDGVSWRIIRSDLEAAYSQAVSGVEIKLPAKTNTYNDFAELQYRFRDSYILAREIPYWTAVQKKLEKLPYSASKTHSRRFEHITVSLNEQDTDRFLHANFDIISSDVNDALLTAVGAGYRAITGEDSVSVQLEGHGREDMGEHLITDRTVGWFTAMYPVILEDLNGDVRHDLLMVKETLHRVPNKGVGYNVLRYLEGKENIPVQTERMEKILFNYLGDMSSENSKDLSFFRASDIYTGKMVSAQNNGDPDLTINCFVINGSFELWLEYNADAFGSDDARKFADSILSEMNRITDYLSECNTPAVTASDLGETEWTEEEFEKIASEFAAHGEHLERIYPLLPMQEGMLFKNISEPDSLAYRIADIYEADTVFTEEQLRRALERLGRKHEVLRTSIIYRRVSQPRQAIVDRQLGLTMLDISDSADPEKELAIIRRNILKNGFDLQEKPLFCLTCVKSSPEHSYIIISVHHAVIDGWCSALYMSDLVRYLSEALNGVETEDEDVVSGRYEKAVREILNKDKNAGLKYWRELLSDYETQARIPSYGTVPENERSSQDMAETYIDEETTARFTDICREADATVSNGAELVWGLVNAVCNRTEDVVFAKVVSGRDNTAENIDDVVGLFINSIPVRVKFDRSTTVRQALSQLGKQNAASNDFDYCPLEQVQKQTSLGSNLFQSVLAFENYNSGKEEIRIDSLLRPVEIREEVFDDINPVAMIDNGKLMFAVAFNTGRYRESEMNRIIGMISKLVKEITEHPDSRISELELLDSDEKAEVLELSTGETLEYDSRGTWVDLFRTQAVKTPDHIAVTDSEGSFTYREIDRISDSVAAYLLDSEVKPDTFVAIKMGRSKLFPAAVLGIHKAGAAYLPIDADYPEERISYMLEDSEATIVLTEETVRSAIDMYENPKAVNLAKTNNLAYMIYTSGSTGKPKGVMIRHSAMLNLVNSICYHCRINENSRISSHPNFSFDASVESLYPALTVGGCVFIVPENERHDIFEMRKYIAENKINGCSFPTQFGQLISSDEPLDVEYITLGGEALTAVPNVRGSVFNAYGPTEFTVTGSIFEVDKTIRYDNIPIGRPIANCHAFIVGLHGELLPRGIAGELCLAGPQIAKGYWKREKLTAEKFVDCPYLKGQKMYRTGDLARYNEDGQLEYLGRIDTQVKLRGFRIELGEIESRASEFEGIKAVAAAVKKDNLVLYYTSENEIDNNKLRSFLSESLTEYMIPSVYMRLPEMPFTPNGKIDRKALPEPGIISDEEIIAPETETEKKLFELAAEILRTDKFGITSNLVSFGLSSLGAMRLSGITEQKLGVRVSVSMIMQKPEVKAIAALIDSNDIDAHKALAPYETQETYPITENQRGIIVDWQMKPDTTQYNIPSITVYEHTDGEKLLEAVRAVINAHSYLKVRFEYSGDDIVQRRNDDEAASVTIEKLTQKPEGTFFQSRIKPFDLLKDRLYRVEIYTYDDTSWLFMDMHHTIYDGFSDSVLRKDLREALEGKIPENEKFTAFDYALYERERIDSEEYKTIEKYFDGLLSDAIPARLTDSDKPDGTAEGVVSISVDAGIIDAFCRSNGVTPGSFLQAAFSEVLTRITREAKVMYTTVSSGRSADIALQSCVGMFVRTLPIAGIKSANMTTGDYVREMHKQLNASYDRDIYPYTKLVSRHHLYAEMMFVYQELMAEDISLNEQEELSLGEVKMPLSVDAWKDNDSYILRFEYDGRKYSSKDITRFGNAVKNAAESLAQVQYVKDIRLVSCEEQEEILSVSTGETLDYDKTGTWIDLFRTQVEKTPERNAVTDSEGSFTYRELDKVSDSIAAYLLDNNIKPNSFVAVKMGRSKLFTAAVIGIHKAGAAYLPIDADYPEERIAYMLEDSEASIVITEDTLRAAMNRYENAKPINLSENDCRAYMIYTSGSTGKPKGVMIPHRAMLNFVHFIRYRWKLTENSRIACHSNFSFDASVEDLYPALTVGGCVFIVPEKERHDIFEMRKYISENDINGGCYTTQFGQLLSDKEALNLDYLCVGGEAMTSVPNVRGAVYNTYGPTEFTVDATYYELDKSRKYDNIPIGTPLTNCYAFIVGPHCELMPRGIAGELCLAGPQIAEGYWKREELTAEKFVNCPYLEGQKMYRTGDLAKYNDAGQLEYLGRIDTQVKLRGFRIELGEIESRASAFEGIRTVAAKVHKDFLVLYYTSENKIESSVLKAFLSQSLTEYMVPSVYMRLSEMPMTPNGKIDRKALPEPKRSKEEFVAPETDREKEFCKLYEEVLGLEEVGVTDSFFDLGGTSLSAARIVAYAVSKGYPITYQDIFRTPSPKELATLTESVVYNEADINILTKQKQISEYDYNAINKLISYNSMENINDLNPSDLGDIILIGATGFLGLHVLKAFIDNYDGKVTCLVRNGRYEYPEARLKNYLMYYFDDPMEEQFGKRIFCIEGDITVPDSLEKIAEAEGDTIINCAASVKHFVSNDLLDKVNYHGTEALIRLCEKTGKRLIHTSTVSVVGEVKNEYDVRFKESDLYVGQSLENDYLRTKFLAERELLAAVSEKRIKGCVIRMGNLVSRNSDGEFQMNFRTNSFMRSLRSFAVLKKFPYDALDENVELTPIDEAGNAVLKLASVGGDFTVFHALNNHVITMADVIFAMKGFGYEIETVSAEEFSEAVKIAAESGEDTESVLGIVAYRNRNSENPGSENAEPDSRFSNNVLMRCGFKWSITDNTYLEKMLSALDGLGFFDNKYLISPNKR